MSNIYIQEPPTNGKVLLVTSVGDIDVELWSKEAPKACRNFVQLCLEGYYDDTVFHRVVQNFIVQGGDPGGTGEGGESIYGKTFKDEFHSRLRFNRRGLLGMANAGKNDNASQFFFTLGEAGELNNKHTLFGKITGNTIYNMVKLGECEVEDERPLYPHKVIKTTVLNNPFDDIIPRTTKKKSEKSEKKATAKAKKDFKLLSFGEEAEEDEEQTLVATTTMKTKSKSKSSHDVLDDEKLSTLPAVDTANLSSKNKRKKKKKGSNDESSEEEETLKDKIRKKLRKEDATSKDFIVDDDSDEDPAKLKSDKILELQKEAKRLKKELRAVDKEQEKKQEEANDPGSKDSEVVKEFKADKMKYVEEKKKLKKGSDRENSTLALLASFQSKLSAASDMAGLGGGGSEEEEDNQEVEDKDIEDSSDLSWMNHKLRCNIQDKTALDANVQELNRYEIFDPRNPLNKRRREASKKLMKETKR